MKKITILFVLTVGLFAAVQAQPRAVGGRIGVGLDASYQHSLGSNMVEVELGLFGFWGIEAAATYDWIFPINSWQNKGEWNWYAGVGAGLGLNGWNNSYFFLGAAGRIGVEYNFWFPLQLSIDYRPVVGPAFGMSGGGVAFNSWGLYAGAIGLGVRYKF